MTEQEENERAFWLDGFTLLDGAAAEKEATQAAVQREARGLIRVLAEGITVHRHERFCRDVGGKLYRYRNGCYSAGGERFIAMAVKHLLISWKLSTLWSSRLATEVAAYVGADVVDLWEAPPPDEVCLLNGIFNVKTRVLRQHTPTWLSTVQLPVSYDRKAKCPENERFMQQVYAADSFDKGVPWELEARYMLPATGNRKADLFLGEGGTGKSTRLSRLKLFLGRRNCASMSLHRLENDRFSVAQLYGRLANICPDLPSQHLETTSTFKAITGGDELVGEYKFRDSFAFVPFAHLAFSANQPPRASDASTAFFDRWNVHTFDRRFRGTTEEVRQAELLARLGTHAELSGVLNHALDALDRMREHGPTVTPSMTAALEELREATDPFSVWAAHCLVDDASANVAKSEVRESYNRYARDHGFPPQTSQGLGREVKRRFPNVGEKQRLIGGRYVWCYVGIGLVSVFSAEAEQSRESRELSSLSHMTPARAEEEKDRANRVIPVIAVRDVLAEPTSPEIDKAACSASGCWAPAVWISSAGRTPWCEEHGPEAERPKAQAEVTR